MKTALSFLICLLFISCNQSEYKNNPHQNESQSSDEFTDFENIDKCYRILNSPDDIFGKTLVFLERQSKQIDRVIYIYPGETKSGEIQFILFLFASGGIDEVILDKARLSKFPDSRNFRNYISNDQGRLIFSMVQRPDNKYNLFLDRSYIGFYTEPEYIDFKTIKNASKRTFDENEKYFPVVKQNRDGSDAEGVEIYPISGTKKYITKFD